MIHYLSIACTLLFILQISLNTLVFIQFKIQQEYITKEVCVQRNETLNTCKGNCYLKAHLQKQDPGSVFSISYLKEKVDLYFNECDFHILTFRYKEKNLYESIFYAISTQNGNDIFHPPS